MGKPEPATETRRSRRVRITSGIGAVVATAWWVITLAISVANLPSDASDAWKAVVSAPEYIPFGLAALFIGVLIWSLWPWGKSAPAPSPATNGGDRYFQEELAKLDAAERARAAVQMRKLTGFGYGVGDILEEQEKDRKAEAEARRQRLIREASEAPSAWAIEEHPLQAAVKAKAQLMRDRLASRNCHLGGFDSPRNISWLAAMWDSEERGQFLDDWHRSTFMPQRKGAPRDLPGDTIPELQRNVMEYNENRRKANQLYQRRRDLIAKGRDVVHHWRASDRSEPFEIFASKDRGYLDIQPHLGHDYQVERSRAADRIIYGPEHDENRVAALLQELARLAREWNVE